MHVSTCLTSSGKLTETVFSAVRVDVINDLHLPNDEQVLMKRLHFFGRNNLALHHNHEMDQQRLGVAWMAGWVE